MDSAAVVAGAGAAILASALTGLTTFWATRETLKHNSSDLATQLADERDAAREDREQDRRKEAYVSLLRYVFWLSDVNRISRRVIARQHSAVSNLRTDGGAPGTSEEAASERAAFESAGPTPEEQRRLDAGPTGEDNAATNALVTALSSNAVLGAFEELMERDRDFASKQRSVAVALLREPKPTRVETSVDDAADADQVSQAADAAKKVIESAARLLDAIRQAVDAGKEFDDAAEKLRKLVRGELQQPRST